MDRVYVVKVPYCMRASEEENIYRKLISGSELSEAPCAPFTYEMIAQYSILTRIVEPENSNIFFKLKYTVGKTLRDKNQQAKL